MKVHEFMHDLDLAHKELSLADTVSKMNEILASSVAVHNHSEILGVINHSEITAALSQGAANDTKLNDMLDHKLYSIDADDSMARARILMDKHRLDKLVVTRNTNIIGVLTSEQVHSHFKYELGSLFSNKGKSRIL